MGIRYEKDTILNWVNEMGKFLRLLVDKWEGKLQDLDSIDIEVGYKEFFKETRDTILSFDEHELTQFAETLESEQIRPLAQLLMYDGLLTADKGLLKQAKVLFEAQMRMTGSFSFEDYGYLARIDQSLNS